jgi:hypothetical protein
MFVIHLNMIIVTIMQNGTFCACNSKQGDTGPIGVE